MRKNNTLILIFLFLQISTYAQGKPGEDTRNLLGPLVSGFTILFAAVFFFSYILKTIKNQKDNKLTSKQIMGSSLILGFLTALASITILYFALF